MNKKHFISLITLFSLVKMNSVAIDFISLSGGSHSTIELPLTKHQALDMYFEKAGEVTVASNYGTATFAEALGLERIFIQKILLSNEDQRESPEDALTLSLLFGPAKCRVTLDFKLDPDDKYGGGEYVIKKGCVAINHITTHTNPIIDQEVWRFTCDGEHEHSSALKARSALATPNLLLGQFFGKPNELQNIVEPNPDIYLTSDSDYLEILPERRTDTVEFDEIYMPRRYDPEYSIDDHTELLKLLKFLQHNTEAVLPRICADLGQEYANDDNVDWEDPINEIIPLDNHKFFPRLKLMDGALAHLGVTQEEIDSVPGYIPVTATLAYDSQFGLNFGFFCHNRDGAAELIFSKALSETLFTDENERYFDDDPNYNKEQFDRYLAFLSKYLEAPIHVEYDPIKRIIPYSLNEWILMPTSDIIPPSGVILNRITFEKLCELYVALVQEMTGEDAPDLHITNQQINTVFGPTFEGDGRYDISEDCSSEDESEFLGSDPSIDGEVNVCPYLTDDDF